MRGYTEAALERYFREPMEAHSKVMDLRNASIEKGIDREISG